MAALMGSHEILSHGTVVSWDLLALFRHSTVRSCKVLLGTPTSLGRLRVPMGQIRSGRGPSCLPGAPLQLCLRPSRAVRASSPCVVLRPAWFCSAACMNTWHTVKLGSSDVGAWRGWWRGWQGQDGKWRTGRIQEGSLEEVAVCGSYGWVGFPQPPFLTAGCKGPC